jgi:galactokinase
VAVSGVAAEKTGSAMEKYNAASRSARKLVELWQQATGGSEAHLAAVAATGPDAASRLATIVQGATLESDVPALLRRLGHFFAENEEIQPAAGDALANGDLEAFGRLVDRSQRAAEDLLANQIPETSCLASAARWAGAAAASAFGAGFGGSVWALVEGPRFDSFLAAWSGAYRERFAERADSAVFFRTNAGPSAMRVC